MFVVKYSRPPRKITSFTPATISEPPSLPEDRETPAHPPLIEQSIDTPTMSNKPGIQRGVHRPNRLGTSTLIGLRALDPLLQYNILSPSINLARPLITTLGGRTLASAPAAVTGLSLIDNNTNLSPYRLALLSMAVGSSLKHIFWASFINGETLAPSMSARVGMINTVVNSLNSVLFMTEATSAAKYIGEGTYADSFPGIPLAVGGTLFTAGIVIETLSELQRKAFKKRPEGQGKPYTKGLFGVVRHVNYTAYTMWRTGFALAAGGWVWGAMNAAGFLTLFVKLAIPELDEYCENRVSALLFLGLGLAVLLMQSSCSTRTCGMTTSARCLTNSSPTCCRLGRLNVSFDCDVQGYAEPQSSRVKWKSERFSLHQVGKNLPSINTSYNEHKHAQLPLSHAIPLAEQTSTLRHAHHHSLHPPVPPDPTPPLLNP